MPDRGVTRRRRTLALDSFLVAVATIGILLPLLELWNSDLRVPFAYVRDAPGPYAFVADAPFYQLLAKGGIDHAWFLTNPSLGAPFGQQLFDFPVSLDNLNLVVLKALGVATGDVGLTVNLFFLLSFVTAAVAMYLVMRALGVSRAVAGLVGLLFTFLPYHFVRGVPHLFLSAYWIVPVAGYLVVRVVSRRPPFIAARDPDHVGGRTWRVQWRDRSALLWLLVCIAVASSGAYYAGFIVLFLVVLAGVDFIARRRAQVVASAGVVLATIAVVGLVNLAPTFVSWAFDGRNTTVVARGPAETEFEGLKLSQLVLPVVDHRVGAMAHVQELSTRHTPTRSEPGQQLGVIGALGLLGLLVGILVGLRRTRTSEPGRDAESYDAFSAFGVLTVTGILMATIGGFSMLLYGFGLRELRAWNRISVFFASFAFTAVAFGLDWFGGWCRRRGAVGTWWRLGAGVGIAALLVVGVLDQVSPAVVPDYQATAQRWHSDARFVSHVERTLPRGASVFQLPYRFFPEAQMRGALGPYDLGRLYLHSSGLRWSWGGMRGRQAGDWPASTSVKPVEEMLDRVAAAGFDGLVDDVGVGYRAGAASPDDITKALGQRPFVSRDRELLFWDLRERRRALRARLGAAGVRQLRAETLDDRSVPIPSP